MWIGGWIQTGYTTLNSYCRTQISSMLFLCIWIRVDVALALRSRSKYHFSKTKKSSVPEIFHLLNVLTRKKHKMVRFLQPNSKTLGKTPFFSPLYYSSVHTAQEEFSTGWNEKRPLGFKSQKELWRDCVASLIDHIAVSNTSNDITARWPGYDPNC